MPPIAIEILNYIRLAMAAAPQVKELIIEGRKMVDTLFGVGLITKEQQDACHAYCDEVQRAALAGEVPPELTIEADPS